MPRNPIPRLRLAAQQLLAPVHNDPATVVRHLGAVQAQDFPMALWAVGARMRAGTLSSVTDALDSGRILRTHLLRPTWHLVAAEDVRWMLQLSAPQIRPVLVTSSKIFGLEPAHFRKAKAVFEKRLAGGREAARAELATLLEAARIPTGPHCVAHLLMDAELDGLLCSGSGAGRQGSYRLLEERVPPNTDHPTRDEAAARLAQRYYTSHGPASFEDFTWWSGLPRGLARSATEAVRSLFESLHWEGMDYLVPGGVDTQGSLPAQLLPAFDEYLIAYKDRSAVIERAHQAKAFTSNGVFRPVLLESGIATATWKRVPKQGGREQLQLAPFDPAAPPVARKLAAPLRRLSQFLGTQVELTPFLP